MARDSSSDERLTLRVLRCCCLRRVLLADPMHKFLIQLTSENLDNMITTFVNYYTTKTIVLNQLKFPANSITARKHLNEVKITENGQSYHGFLLLIKDHYKTAVY
jgi:hypothetical protein